MKPKVRDVATGLFWSMLVLAFSVPLWVALVGCFATAFVGGFVRGVWRDREWWRETLRALREELRRRRKERL
jgi:hypothetical protein